MFSATVSPAQLWLVGNSSAAQAQLARRVRTEYCGYLQTFVDGRTPDEPVLRHWTSGNKLVGVILQLPLLPWA
jgi:hypothetical protein